LDHTAASALLAPHLLSPISRLEMVARQVMDGYVQGLHRSAHLGFATDFAQHRQYVPGDDLKRIDWRVYAKVDRYYIRQYEVTTNLRAYLLVDASGSMGYRGPQDAMSKYRYAQFTAACLAYLLLHQQDSCGLITMDEKICDFIPARSTASHLITLARTLDARTLGVEGKISRTLHEAAERLRYRSMVIVISDLLEAADDIISALHHLRHRRHEVLLLQVLAHDEIAFPFRQWTLFKNMESAGHQLRLDPAVIRRNYLDALAAHRRAIEKACSDLRISYQLIDTRDSVDQALTAYLSTRLRERGI
jgi:uncharacterized protein (DUF58 family)